MLFLDLHGLAYTFYRTDDPIPIISCGDRLPALIDQYGERRVVDHKRAWCFLLDATADAPFEESLMAATNLVEAWHIIVSWGLPDSDAEKTLLVRQLETTKMLDDEDPKLFFARLDKILNTLKSVGIVKEEREIVQIIKRNLSSEYDVELRAMTTQPNRQVSRLEVEQIVRNSYATRKTRELDAVPAQAPAHDPHALAVNGGPRGGFVGGRRQGRGGHGASGGWIPPGRRGHPQQWTMGGPPPFSGGRSPQPQFSRQQQQQQRQPFRSPTQQPRPMLQQQAHQHRFHPRPQQSQRQHFRHNHLQQASPKWGVGGLYDCGSNATGWHQEESPPPGGAQMGALHQCKRCGRLGHLAEICSTPQRFEGFCDCCGQYGHQRYYCMVHRSGHTHPHANIMNFPHQAGARGNFTGGGGGGTTGAFWSQGQVSNLDGANAWPGWYDGGGVVVPPFGGDASGGSGQLYNGSGAGVLTGGGDGGQQYSSSGPGGVEDSYANFGISGGSPPFSGGNDGVNVSDRDGLGTSRPAMAGQQLDGDEGHDEGGLLGTFGDFPHEPLEDDGFPTVGPALHVLAHPSNRHRHALLSLSKHHVAGADWWVGDSGASVHGTGNKEHMYNIRVPVAEESRLVVGNGETMKVQFIGDLDLVMHCNPDVVVTLRDVSYVPGLWYDLMSFSIIQEMHEIRLNKTGAHILDGRVHFRKNRNGNYVQATRILRGSRGPPAMVAALMRPGRVRSMSINDPHYALGHANEATARATAKQLEIQVTGSLGHCAGCANGKAIRAAVPKTTSLRATRPLERTFGDLTGPFPVGSGVEERSQRQLPQQQQPIASFGAGVGSGAEEQSQRQLPQQQQPIAPFGARVGSGAEERSQRQLPQQQQPIAGAGAGANGSCRNSSSRLRHLEGCRFWGGGAKPTAAAATAAADCVTELGIGSGAKATAAAAAAAIACHLELGSGSVLGRRSELNGMCHFDAEQAFVQSELDEDLYIRLPQGCGELSGGSCGV